MSSPSADPDTAGVPGRAIESARVDVKFVARPLQPARPDFAQAPGAAAAPRTGEPSAAGVEPAVPYTILVVEDSPIHLKLLARQLESYLGVRVLAVDGVENAVQRLLAGAPDLIISDLMMPGLSGLDLMAIVRSRPDWAEIPFVVYSAVNDVSRVQAFCGTGLTDYILKPFDAARVIPRIRRILTRPRPARAAAPPSAAVPAEKIPVVLGTTRPGVDAMAQEALGDLYRVCAVAAGPTVLATAIQVQAFAVLLVEEPAPWDASKTLKALHTLRTLSRLRAVMLPASNLQAVATIRREFALPPFMVEHDATRALATIAYTFVPSCVAPLRHALTAVVADGGRNLVIEIPDGLNPATLELLRRLGEELAPQSRLRGLFRAAPAHRR